MILHRPVWLTEKDPFFFLKLTSAPQMHRVDGVSVNNLIGRCSQILTKPELTLVSITYTTQLN